MQEATLQSYSQAVNLSRDGKGRQPVNQLHERLNLQSAFEMCHEGQRLQHPAIITT